MAMLLLPRENRRICLTPKRCGAPEFQVRVVQKGLVGIVVSSIEVSTTVP